MLILFLLRARRFGSPRRRSLQLIGFIINAIEGDVRRPSCRKTTNNKGGQKKGARTRARLCIGRVKCGGAQCPTPPPMPVQVREPSTCTPPVYTPFSKKRALTFVPPWAPPFFVGRTTGLIARLNDLTRARGATELNGSAKRLGRPFAPAPTHPPALPSRVTPLPLIRERVMNGLRRNSAQSGNKCWYPKKMVHKQAPGKAGSGGNEHKKSQSFDWLYNEQRFLGGRKRLPIVRRNGRSRLPTVMGHSC